MLILTAASSKWGRFFSNYVLDLENHLLEGEEVIHAWIISLLPNIPHSPELILLKNAAVFLSITACKSFLLCQTNTCGGSSYNGKSPTPFDAGVARYKCQIILVMHKWWTPHEMIVQTQTCLHQISLTNKLNTYK